MKKSLVSFASLAMLLVAGTCVQADSIPWGYSATSTTIYNNNNPIQTSSIAMAGSSGVASGNSGIIIYNLTTSSSATDSAPDSFSNVPFNLAVTLTDIKATSSTSPTAQSTGVVNFSGTLSASNVTTKSLLPGVTTWTSPTTAQVTLGADDTGWSTYTVSINSITPPGQPGGAPGSIQAIVEITPGTPGTGTGEGPPSSTPEPASMVLAGFGLPFVVLLRRRFKKASAA